jgi:hypothetical protein
MWYVVVNNNTNDYERLSDALLVARNNDKQGFDVMLYHVNINSDSKTVVSDIYDYGLDVEAMFERLSFNEKQAIVSNQINEYAVNNNLQKDQVIKMIDKVKTPNKKGICNEKKNY